jgi:chaperonin GroES
MGMGMDIPVPGPNQQAPMEGMAPPGSGMEPAPMAPGGPIGQTPPQPDQVDPEQQQRNYIDYALSQQNLALHLKEKDGGEELLAKIGTKIYEGYTVDEQSREGWMNQNKEWLKMAMLVREGKAWPWPNASNVKYPLIATAAMQFSARAYPALVPNDGRIVKTRVSKNDKQGIFQKKAVNVAVHMSYQVLCAIPGWEEDMDKLLMTMAISGICFKKTYHDGLTKKHISRIVYPENLVINNYARCVEDAYRKTEILYFNANELLSKIRNDEEFLDQEYGNVQDVGAQDQLKEKVSSQTTEPQTADESSEHVFLACHTYWDLDEDGYEEPYVITIHKATRKVARIIARWDSDKVYRNSKGEIARIDPVEYFTAFPFIPNADGTIYACGFGMLLAPLNEAVNTLVNQLIDGGTMNTLQSGFLSRNLRIKKGNVILKPGEWLTVNASGEELQKGFYPLPSKEPSPVLFQLMNLLIQSGNQLASIAEIMVGKMPGQNTPAGTTQTAVEQSMAVFTAIYKRVYRALHGEFKKIYRLNRITPDIVKEESAYIDEPLTISDYEGTEDFIIPGADPTGDSGTTRMQKLSALQPLLQMGTIDPTAYTDRFLEAVEVPNAEQLKPQPQQPQPDPKAQAAQQDAQNKQQESQAKVSLLQQKGQQAQEKHQMDMEKTQAYVAAQERLAQIEAAQKANDIRHQQTLDAMDRHAKATKDHQDMVMRVLDQHFKTQSNIGDAMHTDAKNEAQRNHQMAMQRIQRKSAADKPKGSSKGA